MATLIYLDTHVIVWLYLGRVDLLSDTAANLLEERPALMSPMALLELQYLNEVERLRVSGGEVVASLHAQIGLEVCDLAFPRVVEAALSQTWTRDPFDRLIVGHASAAGRELLTGDDSIRTAFPDAVW